MYFLTNDKKQEQAHLLLYFFLVTAFITQFSWFENFADLKFFGGVGLPFDLWIKAFPVADGYLEAPCSDVEHHLRVGTRQPVLFKGCISEDLDPTDFIYFEESQTNVFPECGAMELIQRKGTPPGVERHFDFENIDGETQHFHEWYPCADARTLKEKRDEWQSHDQETEGTYSNLHVYMASKEEKRRVLRDWSAKNVTHFTPTFLDSIPAAFAHFFHDGRTAVDYFHAHMDHGIMLNFGATRVWTLIAPEFHDYYDYLWSGNANVLLKEHKVAPRVVIEQEKGDILYMPTWWVHKLGLDEETTIAKSMTKTMAKSGKNFGLSIHMMRSDQFTGVGARVAQWFDVTNWFYRNSFE